MRLRESIRFRSSTVTSVYWSVVVVLFVQPTLFDFRSAEAIVCTGCTAEDRRDCPSVDDCRGGRTSDPCDCCPECARVEGETCGGRYRAEGLCDEGLVCVITPVPGAVITGDDVGTCRGKHLYSIVVGLSGQGRYPVIMMYRSNKSVILGTPRNWWFVYRRVSILLSPASPDQFT